jgi:hypothetical protein
LDASDMTLPKGWMLDGPGDVASNMPFLSLVWLEGWEEGCEHILDRAKRWGMVA